LSLILGLNLNHDASVAITTNDGTILFSVAEERVNRQKGSFGFPKSAIELARKKIDFALISHVVVGSHSRFDLIDMPSAMEIFEPEVAIKPGFAAGGSGKGVYGRFPGFEAMVENLWSHANLADSHAYFVEKISKLLNLDCPISFVNHHDSHAACAFYGSSFQSALVVTLDGSGDGECGTIKVFSDGEYKSDLLRTDSYHSLGLIYSAVTKRYNFLPGRHEGKITGLAAYGNQSRALDYLKSIVIFKNGTICLRIPQNKFERIKSRIQNKVIPKEFPILFSLQEVVDHAATLTNNYPDLAFAVQKLLEERIVEMVDFWLRKTGQKNLAVAGGVFSNVRINQMLAELPNVENVFIYPDMGDSGLAVGGIWQYLASNQSISGGQRILSMTIGPKSSESGTLPKNVIRKDFIWNTDLPKLARELQKGKTVAVVIGNMEIGPRALCNRSILASCADSEINLTLNRKLNRTEFMPFAPVATDRLFSEIFNISNHGSLVPFYFMTMACDVNASWIEKIPAAVHVDGTARPQLLLREQNHFVYDLIEEYGKLTQVPVLINTSFNAHEEPIIMNLDQGLEVLSRGSVDYLVTEDSLYEN